MCSDSKASVPGDEDSPSRATAAGRLRTGFASTSALFARRSGEKQSRGEYVCGPARVCAYINGARPRWDYFATLGPLRRRRRSPCPNHRTTRARRARVPSTRRMMFRYAAPSALRPQPVLNAGHVQHLSHGIPGAKTAVVGNANFAAAVTTKLDPWSRDSRTIFAGCFVSFMCAVRRLRPPSPRDVRD